MTWRKSVLLFKLIPPFLAALQHAPNSVYHFLSRVSIIASGFPLKVAILVSICYTKNKNVYGQLRAFCPAFGAAARVNDGGDRQMFWCVDQNHGRSKRWIP